MRGIDEGYDLIVTNFANGDVIGHTSSNEAKLKCASIVDCQLGHVVEAALARDYVVFITADHGNLEEMKKTDGTPHVSHTANPVQFILMDPRSGPVQTLSDGQLGDVAPTVLSALGLEQSAAMSGATLAPGHGWNGKRRVLLIILDGWGIGRPDDGNPIFLARTPVWDRLVCKYPHSSLRAAGEAVGLQPGKTGNSEAGHMNLGAGRVVLQDDVRLDMAMNDGSFESNPVFLHLMEHVQRNGTRLHLIGLLTAKSSHGCIDYPLALLRMAKKASLQEVFLHIIFDGRSTEPGSAPALLEKLEARLEEIGLGQVVSGVGRSLALDRDGNYEKTRRAFDACVSGTGRHFLAD
jgi:2,3-bisphosphoglycerate-independent phosphoglycerate mutase